MMDLSTREQSYDIALSNCQDFQAVDESVLEEVARHCLAHEGVLQATISIALVDNAGIRRLNREYLSHDFETDVLSFLLDMELVDPSLADNPQPEKSIQAATRMLPRGTGKRLDGEVILSVEMAVHAAARFGWRPQDELRLYLVHGLLHLCGYDDATAAGRQLMRAHECQVLEPWGLKPSYDELPRDRGMAEQPSPTATEAGADR